MVRQTGLSWHISTLITKNVDSGKIELKSYAHIFDSCQQDWYAVCSIIENTLEVVKKEHPQITQVNLRSDEAGCYHNNFLLAAVRDAGRRVGIEVARYDFSEPQYGKGICDRILCPNHPSDDIAMRDTTSFLPKMLVSTAKFAETLIRCMTSSEETGRRNSLLLIRTEKTEACL